MINTVNDSRMNPDIKQIKHITADMLTGDGIFANTDLMRINKPGWLIVNVVGDNVAHELYVPQLNHKESYANATPVLNSGLMPDILKVPNYKVWIEPGSSPAIMIDLNTGTAACALGCFFQGRDNPVAAMTPDILVMKALTATASNALEGTDLENCPYRGMLLIWTMSDQIDTQVQVRQRNHRTGSYSLSPSDAAGLSVDISKYAPFKLFKSATQEFDITITEVTSANIFLVAAFFAR
jgi:hypothetical protein